jgi:hypothetical protein
MDQRRCDPDFSLGIRLDHKAAVSGNCGLLTGRGEPPASCAEGEHNFVPWRTASNGIPGAQHFDCNDRYVHCCTAAVISVWGTVLNREVPNPEGFNDLAGWGHRPAHQIFAANRRSDSIGFAIGHHLRINFSTE